MELERKMRKSSKEDEYMLCCLNNGKNKRKYCPPPPHSKPSLFIHPLLGERQAHNTSLEFVKHESEGMSMEDIVPDLLMLPQEAQVRQVHHTKKALISEVQKCASNPKLMYKVLPEDDLEEVKEAKHEPPKLAEPLLKKVVVENEEEGEVLESDYGEEEKKDLNGSNARTMVFINPTNPSLPAMLLPEVPIRHLPMNIDPMNINVDEMTYEQLLELGEMIGKVSKGLTQEQINVMIILLSVLMIIIKQ